MASVLEKETLYISFDLETLGGNPDDETVLNWGFVAYTEKERKKIGSLSVNTLPRNPDAKTLEWFQSTPELKAAYETCTKDAIDPREGMLKIREWIGAVSKGYRVVLVAYPTIFDGSLLYAYWFRFLGHPSNGRGPGFTILDIRSYAAGKLGINYHDTSKEKALKPFCPDHNMFPHTHTGIDDAEEQMWVLFNLMDHGISK